MNLPNQSGVKRRYQVWVILAGVISLVGVVIHIGAIFGGVAWYVYFGAPHGIVESARQGTWLAPLGASVIAGLMALCAAYAFSAIGVIPRLPLLRTGLAVIATICLLRAIVLWPLMISHPELRNTFEIVASIVWGLAGVGFAMGLVSLRQPSAESA